MRGCVGRFSVPHALLAAASLLPGFIAAAPAAGQSRRVVDVVTIGDPASDSAHEYAAEGAVEAVAAGKRFRQAQGWMRYSLRVYEDSEVTLACTFTGTEGRRLVFDLIVEGRKVLTHTFVTPSAEPTRLEFRLPQSLTGSLTAIAVMFRGVDGPTPGLIELRTVQEHLER